MSVDSTARSASREFTAQKTNTGGHEPEAKRQKQGSLEYASKARRSHDLKQETELDQSLEGVDEVFKWRPPPLPNKAQDLNKHQTPLQRYVSKTEEEILSKQQYIDRLKEKESEIVINLQVLVNRSDFADVDLAMCGTSSRSRLFKLWKSKFNNSSSVMKNGLVLLAK